MRMHIRRSNLPCVIISFRTKPENFDSDYERIKFFRGLYGWDQTVPGNDKKYRYRRSGLLDDIPHQKIADSVFLIAMEHMKVIDGYFKQWEEKVDWEAMEILMKKEIRRFKFI